MRWNPARASLLTVFAAVAIASTLASAAGVAPAFQSGTWAYGETWAFSCGSLSACAPGYSGATGNLTINSLSADFFLGAAVIFNENVVNSNVATLGVEKVLATHAALGLSATCTQGCGTTGSGTSIPDGTTVSLNATAQALYKGFDNTTLENNATVMVGGVDVAAYGMQSGTSSQTANGSLSASISSAGLGISSSEGDLYFAAQVNANLQATFSPALGIIPASPYTGEAWTSQATWWATSSGYIAAHEYEPCDYITAEGGTSCSGNSDTVNESVGNEIGTTGTITLSGEDLGWYNITAPGGQTYAVQIITLAWGGSITCTDAIFLTSGTIADYVGDTAGGGMLTSAVDHLGLSQASSKPAVVAPDGLDYSTTAGTFGVVGSSESNSDLGELGDLTGSTSSGETPESVATAQQQASSLQVPPQMGSASTGGGGSNMLFLVVILVAVVAVVVVIGAVMWTGKRKKAQMVAAPTAPAPAAAPAQAPYYQAPPAGYPAQQPPQAWPQQPNQWPPQGQPPAPGAPPQYR